LLSAAQQADLRTLAGWPHDQAEVAATGERLADRWLVLGMATEDRADKVTERRVWLQGIRSARMALLLDHAFAGRGFEQPWLTGTAVDATLAYFPGASPLRALAVERGEASGPHEAGRHVCDKAGDPSPEAPWLEVAERVAACPWTVLHPLLLRDVVVEVAQGQAWLRCGDSAWPLQLADDELWRLLACTGGAPVALAAEWDGVVVRPLTAWVDAQRPAWIKEAA